MLGSVEEPRGKRGRQKTVSPLQPVEPDAPPDRRPSAALEGQYQIDSEGLGDPLEGVDGDPVAAALDPGDR